MRRASVLLIILSALAAGCGDSNPAAPSANVPFTVTDLTVGMGAAAANGQALTVDYTDGSTTPVPLTTKAPCLTLRSGDRRSCLPSVLDRSFGDGTRASSACRSGASVDW